MQPSMPAPIDVVAFVRTGLRPLADANVAAKMGAYLKSDQPMFGVSEPNRRPIYRALAKEFPPSDAKEYRATVLALWTAGRWPDPPAKDLGQRDFRYAACAFAERFDEHHVPAHLPLWHRLIAEGAWWDLVDWVACKIVSPTMLEHRAKTLPVMLRWIDDPSMWVRRAAILCQIKHKEATDDGVLFDLCLRRADETDFFIRKAIGWALRQYAHTNPKGVRAFLAKHGDRLAPLSLREAKKHL
ncbi:MAG: DNA alkylation repair protein [Phycisphaerales bacterium]